MTLPRLASVLSKKSRLLERQEEAAARSRAAHDRVREAEAVRDAAAKAGQAALLSVRDAERRLVASEEKVSHLQAQESQITTSRAATAYQEEMDLLQAERARIEAEAFAGLDAESAARAARDHAEEAVGELVRAAHAADLDRGVIDEEIRPILEELEAARLAAESDLSPVVLSAVKAMTRSGRLDIVAGIVGGACEACGSGVPPGKIQRVRAGQENQRCESCGRFLESKE